MSRRHVNRVILIGEVAQDPESGTLGDGTPIVTFVLATGDDRHRVRVLDVQGNRIHVTDLEAVDATPVVDLKPVLPSDR